MNATQRTDALARIASVERWYHRFEFAPGVETPGVHDSAAALRALHLPERCEGMRALDIGTRDGFFAFELRRRGAEVVAVDYMPIESTGFAVARDLLKMDVPYTQENIYHLTPEAHGTFDLVLLLGVLYHLPDPMRALQIVRSLCRGSLYLESFVIDNAVLMRDGTFTTLAALSPDLTGLPLMQFFPGASLFGDPTNFWGPSSVCLREMLEESCFEVLFSEVAGQRATLRCRAVEDRLRSYHTAIATGGLKIAAPPPPGSQSS